MIDKKQVTGCSSKLAIINIMFGILFLKQLTTSYL